MTPTEMHYAHSVEQMTTLGMMCGADVPTPEQGKMAQKRADRHVEELIAYEKLISEIEEMLK